jgi:regulator of replication initiation timing
MELDMGKFDSWVAGLRDTIINASELAKSVASLQTQVGEMTNTLEGLRSLNRTLDENLAWSRSERDRLDSELRTRLADNATLRQSLSEAEKFKTLADERASIIAVLKADNDTIAFRNLELEEENKTIKAQLDKIADVFKPVNEAPKPETVKAPEPFLHPVTGVLQGCDPETKQFVPIKEPGHPEQHDDPGLPDKPWWMDDQDKQSSGF